jgi:hypothetical protein
MATGYKRSSYKVGSKGHNGRRTTTKRSDGTTRYTTGYGNSGTGRRTTISDKGGKRTVTTTQKINGYIVRKTKTTGGAKKKASSTAKSSYKPKLSSAVKSVKPTKSRSEGQRTRRRREASDKASRAFAGAVLDLFVIVPVKLGAQLMWWITKMFAKLAFIVAKAGVKLGFKGLVGALKLGGKGAAAAGGGVVSMLQNKDSSAAEIDEFQKMISSAEVETAKIETEKYFANYDQVSSEITNVEDNLEAISQLFDAVDPENYDYDTYEDYINQGFELMGRIEKVESTVYNFNKSYAVITISKDSKEPKPEQTSAAEVGDALIESCDELWGVAYEVIANAAAVHAIMLAEVDRDIAVEFVTLVRSNVLAANTPLARKNQKDMASVLGNSLMKDISEIESESDEEGLDESYIYEFVEMDPLMEQAVTSMNSSFSNSFLTSK